VAGLLEIDGSGLDGRDLRNENCVIKTANGGLSKQSDFNSRIGWLISMTSCRKEMISNPPPLRMIFLIPEPR
jgi:hypothetical protein